VLAGVSRPGLGRCGAAAAGLALALAAASGGIGGPAQPPPKATAKA
jgi:hypothetical protein